MLKISRSDIVRSLHRDNPWWRPENGTGTVYRKRRAYFSLFKEIALNWAINRSTILMGPRRVGKTVMLHQLVEQAITDGLDPRCVLMISIDTPLYGGVPLENLIEIFQTETGSTPSDRRLIIFDEIQYLRDWEISLKVLTDRYPNTRFIAAGSAAAALKLKSRESGAGRFTDFFLPPLTFAEFLNFRDLEDDLIVPGISSTWYKVDDIEKLNAEFINYLNFGGYPEVVLNKSVQSDVQRYLGRDIIEKVLLSDLPSLYGVHDNQELNRLFTTIAYNSGQEISLDGLAKGSGVAKNTIARYLEYLEAAFLIMRITRVDDSGKRFQRMRNFKVFLTNPSMRSALFSPIGEDDTAIGAMVETAVFSQWLDSNFLRNIHYARWKKGRRILEVDMVGVDPARLKPAWACEIKWSDRHALDQPGELGGLVELAKASENRALQVSATTRSVIGETEVDGIKIENVPSALHCYWIGKYVAKGRAP